MAKQDSKITISTEYTILPPKSKLALPITITSWDELKDKIQKIETSAGSWYGRIGSACIAITVSALIGVVTCSPDNNTGKLVCGGILIASLVAGVLCLFFSEQLKKRASCSVYDVAKWMDSYENQFKIHDKYILDFLNLPVENRTKPLTKPDDKNKEFKKPK